jgi:hypothetical protein
MGNLLLLSVAMGHVKQNAFKSGRIRISTQAEGVGEIFFCLFIILHFVKSYSNLIEHERVSGADPLGLLQLEECRREIVHPQILHADEKARHVTPWEETGSGPVSRHGLLRLILGSKTVPKSDPGCRKILVEIVGLLEVFPSLGVFLDQEIVTSNCVPARG